VRLRDAQIPERCPVAVILLDQALAVVPTAGG
jgi:hypothetical protein